jgi:hypothetical protein
MLVSLNKGAIVSSEQQTSGSPAKQAQTMQKQKNTRSNQQTTTTHAKNRHRKLAAPPRQSTFLADWQNVQTR